MKKCHECGADFTFRSRIKACFSKDNTLICEKCSSEFAQSILTARITFYLPAIIYLIFSYKIISFFKAITSNSFINALINFIIVFLYIIAFEIFAQFFVKYTKKIK